MDDWRQFLTDEERPEAEHLEAQADKLDEERQRVTHKLGLIRNRCIQRRRYAEGVTNA